MTALAKHHTIDVGGARVPINPLCENWDQEFHIEEELSDEVETTFVRTVKNRSPILDFEDSPSPTMKPCRTQIEVEIHCESRRSISGGSVELDRDCYGGRSAPPKSLETTRGRRSRSYSVGVLSPQNISSGYVGRRVRSFEDDVDYDVLKITEFAKGPFFNTDFDIISELGSPCTSKVRYNDTGSIEQLNEVIDFEFYDDFEYENIIPDESDDTETLNGTQKYRELWNLRSTFEEEEECSDTIRMEDVPSSDQSPDSENPDQNKYFDSNSESVNCDDQDRYCESNHCGNKVHCKSRSPNRLHPDSDRRRQTYRNMLASRLKPSQNDKEETSFDSIDTVDTDGDVSDTSRHEATSTSFESTTDNTDSTTESQTNRLRQMKADSGYKSLETQHPLGACAGEKKCLSLDEDELVENESRSIVLPDTSASFDFCSRRRNGKTASKRRREYSRERQMVRVYESINEPETDSRSDLPSGDSFDDPSVPNKRSIFTRFFKSQKERRHKSMSRDYSVDEKSDKIFREFSSYDPRLDNKCSLAVGAHRSPRNHRHRIHRKSLDASHDERRRDRLAPDMHSGSHGSDSSASSARRLSPQDSIEEEDYEQVKQALQWENSNRHSVGRLSISVHEIPIIKLNEEETADA